MSVLGLLLTSFFGFAFFLAIKLHKPCPSHLLMVVWIGVIFALSMLLLARGIDIKLFLVIFLPLLLVPSAIFLMAMVWEMLTSGLLERLEHNKLDKKIRLQLRLRNSCASLSGEQREELETKNASSMANYEGSRSYRKMMAKVKKRRS